MTSGVYTIRNRSNHKLYVGSSAAIEKRWQSHRSMLRQGRHPNNYLQRAWAKYGEESFEFSIIDIADPVAILDREQLWLSDLCSLHSDWGYNISPTAKNTAGSRRSEDTRKRISENTKRQMADPTMRLRLSLAKKGKPETIAAARKGGLATRGASRSEETRKCISEALMGHAVSEETRAKQSAAKKGKPSPRKGVKMRPESVAKSKQGLMSRTPEQIAAWKAKLSEAARRQMSDPAARKRLSQINSGKKMDKSVKQKIRQTLRGKPVHENSLRNLRRPK